MVKLHRISVIESYILESKDLTLEAKKDLEDLKEYLGDDLFDDYMKIRDRIPKDQNEFKDFSKLKKMDLKDVQDFVDNFKSKSDKKKKDKQEGAEKLYEDNNWTVYKITTYPAAQLYGKGTKWCITGRYPGHEDRGQKYFDDYIENNDLDGGYYFYISKEDPDDKYCLLQKKNGKIHSIWEPTDTDVGNTGWSVPSSFPKVDGINIDPKPFKALSRSLVRSIRERNFSDVRDVVKQMKKSNVSLDDTPSEDDPPLTEAVYRNLQRIAKYLIDNGADINVKSSDGRTPIFHAHTPSILSMLIDNGADVNIKDDDGDFCFQNIMYNCDSSDEKEIVSILFKNMNNDAMFSFIKENIDLGVLNSMVEKGIISKKDFTDFITTLYGYNTNKYIGDMEPDVFVSGITRLLPKDKNKAKDLILKYLDTHPYISNKKITKDNIDKVSSSDLLEFLITECWSDEDDHGKGDVYNFLYNDLNTDSYARQIGKNLADSMYNDKTDPFFGTISYKDSKKEILDTLKRGGIDNDKLISYYDNYVNLN